MLFFSGPSFLAGVICVVFSFQDLHGFISLPEMEVNNGSMATFKTRYDFNARKAATLPLYFGECLTPVITTNHSKRCDMVNLSSPHGETACIYLQNAGETEEFIAANRSSRIDLRMEIRPFGLEEMPPNVEEKARFFLEAYEPPTFLKKPLFVPPYFCWGCWDLRELCDWICMSCAMLQGRRNNIWEWKVDVSVSFTSSNSADGRIPANHFNVVDVCWWYHFPGSSYRSRS